MEKNEIIIKDDLKEDIVACINKFNALYGKTGITKILKGSKALKENDFNSNSIKSEFFGKYENKTQKTIINAIDELIENQVLIIKRIEFGRPLLCINENTQIIIKKEEPQQDKEEDENIVKILKLIKNNENIFITGHAGTGKSYILNKLKQKIKNLILTSTTGIASVNIKGQTIHSWANIGICNKPVNVTVEKIMKKSTVKKQLQNAKILAIDEISMLDKNTFDYVDTVLREVREINKPFGGIQTIVIGDFFQLPPVQIKKENEDISKNYCFNSPLWEEFNFKTVLLDKNYRQNEKNLIKALADMRVNNLDNDDINLLKTRECSETIETGEILHIFATNNEADNYNNLKFQSINKPTYNLFAYDGIYKGNKLIDKPTNEREENIFKRIDMVCRAEKTISLKIGARVMLLINLDFEKGLINGSCGVVEEINEDYILVKFDNGVRREIEKHDFEFYKNDVVIALRRQFPIRLAYGITIHKSQGMSLDKLFVDCSRIFEKGQAYVALSRIKTLEGLYLRNFSPSKVMVDEDVVEFYKNLNYCF